jgi:hypothetical protein
VKSLYHSFSDPDPHSIGRLDPDPVGLKGKKKRSQKTDHLAQKVLKAKQLVHRCINTT